MKCIRRAVARLPFIGTCLLVVALSASVFAGEIISEVMAIDTAAGTSDADTTDFLAYRVAYGDYLCGPITVFIKEVELATTDSSDITILYSYSPDPDTYGYVLFDSLNLTASEATEAETRYYQDVIMIADQGVTHLRIITRADGGNVNTAGSVVTISFSGTACPSGR